MDRDLVVQQVSANLATYLGVDATAALRRPAHALLGGDVAATLSVARAANRLDRINPIPLVVEGRALEGVAHAGGDGFVVEVEAAPARAGETRNELRQTLAAISSSTSLLQLWRTIVEEIRALTGFDRVMVYRFADDGSGQVVAESRDDAVEPYLDLHYPATDIPAQARRMYLASWVRYIPDAQYLPVPIVPSLSPISGQPLDLSYAILRSVSPIHLEYMANMGLRASMSISLVVHGRLWGLISCGHRTPRSLRYTTRAACELLARLTSLQIAAHEELEHSAQRARLAGATARLVERARAAADVLDGLILDGRELMHLVGASGVAVFTNDTWKTAGEVPSVAALSALRTWIATRAGGGVVHSDRISAEVTELAPFTTIASGVLGIVLPKPVENALLWFRPEVIETVRWGGNPDKSIASEDGRLHPRASFAQWKKTVRATALPWSPAEVEAALDLRRYATELDLGRQVEREQQAVRLRNELVAVVSHDLRGPINVIKLAAGLLSQLFPGADASLQRPRVLVSRIESAATRMSSLVRDLLDLARIEADRFAVSPAPETIGSLVEDAIELLRSTAESKKIELSVDDRQFQDCVLADRERIFQVLSNLIGNALKFTPAGGHVWVSVVDQRDMFELAVRDDGVGIPRDQLPRLFDRYWQAQTRADGSGLGLYIAKGIVEAHHGQIWAESELGAGTTVRFTLPRA